MLLSVTVHCDISYPLEEKMSACFEKSTVFPLRIPEIFFNAPSLIPIIEIVPAFVAALRTVENSLPVIEYGRVEV